MKIATLDIGSNTVRLLLGELDKNHLQRETVRREITRLAGGFADGRFGKDVLDRTVQAVQRFAGEARSFEAVEIRPVCTGVTREVQDQHGFLKTLEVETGLQAIIIDGTLEAQIGALGAANEVGLVDEQFFMMDIGGFSTEIAFVAAGEPTEAISLELGAVALTEKYLGSDPPSAGELRDCKNAIRSAVEQAAGLAKKATVPTTLVGTAGTVTTLAAMNLKMERYEPYRLNRRVLTVEIITDLLDRMLGMLAKSRLSMPGLEKGREDLMPAGVLICLTIMEALGVDRLLVTEGGVLEGLALWPKWPVFGLSVDQSAQ